MKWHRKFLKDGVYSGPEFVYKLLLINKLYTIRPSALPLVQPVIDLLNGDYCEREPVNYEAYDSELYRVIKGLE